MISSRWPRPIGIIASIGMMPVCTGWPIGRRRMMPGASFSTGYDVVLGDRALAVERLAEGVDDASEQALADGHLQQPPGGAHFVALLQLGVVAEDDGADFGLVEVQREAGDAVAEVEHLVEHGVAETFDLRDAVADLADHADGLLGRRGFHARDLRFELLNQVRHINFLRLRSSSFVETRRDHRGAVVCISQLPLERIQPAAHAAVVDAAPDGDAHAADQRRVDRRRDAEIGAVQPRQLRFHVAPHLVGQRFGAFDHRRVLGVIEPHHPLKCRQHRQRVALGSVGQTLCHLADAAGIQFSADQAELKQLSRQST